MLLEIWNSLLFHPLVNGLMWLNHLTGSLGWAIILFTIALRVAMTPLVIPGLKVSKKMNEIAPMLAKIKLDYKDDKQGLMVAQAKLYKEHGISPAAGCLPQVVQLVILITLFNALNLVIKAKDHPTSLNTVLYPTNKLAEDAKIDTRFAYMDLVKPDTFKFPGIGFSLPGIFLLLSAASQFLSSKMMAPSVEKEKKIVAKTDTENDDLMVSMQQQMLYMFPVMTILVGFNFPSGLVIYWLVFSTVSMLQQYLITGPGGLTPWLKKLNLLKS